MHCCSPAGLKMLPYLQYAFIFLFFKYLLSIWCFIEQAFKPSVSVCRLGAAWSLLWSLNTLTTSLKDLLRPCPSSCLHSFHISCWRTLIRLGKHTHPHASSCKVTHTWNFYGAIVYLLNELLPFLSGCFSLGPSWSSLPHFSMATSPNLPAALPPKCNREMHFRLRWRILLLLNSSIQLSKAHGVAATQQQECRSGNRQK